MQKLTNIKNLGCPSSFESVYFDVFNMHTNIPIDTTISFMGDIFKDAQVHCDTIIDFWKLITACLSTKICSFRNILYRCITVYLWTTSFPQSLRTFTSIDLRAISFWIPCMIPLSCINMSMIFFAYEMIRLSLWMIFLDLNSRNPNLKFILKLGPNSINFFDPTISSIEHKMINYILRFKYRICIS